MNKNSIGPSGWWETGIAYVHLEGVTLVRHGKAYVGVIHVVRYVYRFTLFHLVQQREQGAGMVFLLIRLNTNTYDFYSSQK